MQDHFTFSSGNSPSGKPFSRRAFMKRSGAASVTVLVAGGMSLNSVQADPPAGSPVTEDCVVTHTLTAQITVTGYGPFALGPNAGPAMADATADGNLANALRQGGKSTTTTSDPETSTKGFEPVFEDFAVSGANGTFTETTGLWVQPGTGNIFYYKTITVNAGATVTWKFQRAIP